jgi:MFS family permease
MAYLSRLTYTSSYAGGVLPALILMGLAMGMVMAPSMNTATAGVQPRDAGVASALVSTMQQVGGSIGTAVLSTVAATVTSGYLAAHATEVNVAQISVTHGYAVVFTISASLFAAGALMGAAMFPSKARLTEMRAAGGAVLEHGRDAERTVPRDVPIDA